MLQHYGVVENSKCLNIHVGFIVFYSFLDLDKTKKVNFAQSVSFIETTHHVVSV